jgi:hypothetical protein
MLLVIGPCCTWLVFARGISSRRCCRFCWGGWIGLRWNRRHGGRCSQSPSELDWQALVLYYILIYVVLIAVAFLVSHVPGVDISLGSPVSELVPYIRILFPLSRNVFTEESIRSPADSNKIVISLHNSWISVGLMPVPSAQDACTCLQCAPIKTPFSGQLRCLAQSPEVIHVCSSSRAHG